MIGIYVIRNLVNNKVYIGSSNNIALRWRIHRSDLNNGRHSNSYLQHAWDKYEKENFEFRIILELTDTRDLLLWEQRYLDKFKSYVREFGYNLRERANGGPNKVNFKCKVLGCLGSPIGLSLCNKHYRRVRATGQFDLIPIKKRIHCGVPHCKNAHLALGYCNKHYRRLRRLGSVSGDALSVQSPVSGRLCKVKGCPVKHDSLGYCANHAYFYRKYGRIRSPKVYNRTKACVLKSCGKMINGKGSRGLCHNHYECYRYYKKERNWQMHHFLHFKGGVS